MDNFFTLTEGKIHFALKVIPGSSKNQICEVNGNRLKIKIAAPAEDGKANEELRSFISKQLQCAKRDVLLVAGEKSRLKTVAVPINTKEKLESLIYRVVNFK
jgi:uncharacterized protein (TIGR00251 family)